MVSTKTQERTGEEHEQTGHVRILLITDLRVAYGNLSKVVLISISVVVDGIIVDIARVVGVVFVLTNISPMKRL